MGAVPLKTCTVCKEEKSLQSFYKSNREKDGYGYRCKSCDNLARKTSRNRNIPKKENPTWLGYKRRWLMFKYNMAYMEYENILESQGNSCAICGTINPAGEGVANDRLVSFAVDHDHETGKVRGLLCNLCNRALGFLQDKVSVLESATRYLKRHKGVTDD
jgi:hypothetical protein